MSQIQLGNAKFSVEIGREISNLARCYQCSACSDGCPVAYAMDYHPNQIIHMVKLGLKNKLLKSNAIWVCVSCEACATRCPNEIDIVHLFDVLRTMALRENFEIPTRKVSAFHKIFVEQLNKRGRIDEAALLLRYKMRTMNLFSLSVTTKEALLGFRMLRKGKLKLPPSKVRQKKGVAEIFRRVLPRE